MPSQIRAHTDSNGAIAVVEAFCEAWSNLDFESIAALLSDDIVYRNGPLPMLAGKAPVMDYLSGAGPFDNMEWEILNIASSGNAVLTERIDHISRRGQSAALPIMGTFEVREGLIVEWRDYFDLAAYQAQWREGKSDEAGN